MKYFVFLFSILIFLPTLCRAVTRPATTGDFTILVIRLEFSDVAGLPLTLTETEARYDNAISAIEQFSYETATLTPTFTPTILTLPNTRASYAAGGWGSGSTTLANHADTLALGAGFDPDTYDIVSYIFSNTFSGFQGFSSGSSGRQWINTGTPHASLIAHELGHNFGMGHASTWTTDSATIFGQEGVWREYGNPHDIMGGSSQGFFGSDFINPTLSIKPGWLAVEKRVVVSEGGSFRLYRFDHVDAPDAPGPLTLKFQPPGGELYSIDYRYLADSNGAFLTWNFNGGRSRLLDASPGSMLPSGGGSDREDAALPVGASATDPSGQIKITITGSGGTAPHYYLDVLVEVNPESSDLMQVDLPPRAPAFSDIPLLLTNTSGFTTAWSREIDESGPWATTRFGGSSGVQRLGVETGLASGGNLVSYGTTITTNPLDQFTAVTDPPALVRTSLFKGEDTLFFAGFTGLRSLPRPFLPTALLATGTWRGLAGNETGTLVTVGSLGGVGAVQASNDGGTSWSPASIPAGTPPLADVFFANGLFVAVGESDTILVSNDGLTWIDRSLVGSGDLRSVHFGTGLWCVGGDLGRVHTTATPLTAASWTQVAQLSGPVLKIAYSSSHWYATGAGLGITMTPDDWTSFFQLHTEGEAADFPALVLHDDIVFAAGTTLVDGEHIAYSGFIGERLNAITYTLPSAPRDAISYLNRIYLLTDNSQIHASGILPGTLPEYSLWENAFLDSGSWIDDPDSDRYPNLLEYFFRTHPLIHTDQLPRGQWTAGGQLYFYGFTEADLHKSENLTNWIPAPLPLEAAGEAKLLKIQTAEDREFYRWQGAQ